MTHVTCRLTAKNRDQLRNPALGNRVWAAFTFSCVMNGDSEQQLRGLCVCGTNVQPETYTLVLEYSNLFFSGLFAVEMLMKVLADGLFGYVRNGFNVFDGFIVVLR